MSFVRDKKTGEIYEVDESGNKINIIDPGTSKGPVTFFGPSTGKETKKEPTLENKIYQYGGRFVPDILTAAGGIVGSTFSPILGSAAGAGIGSLAGKTLQIMSPEIYGEPPKSIPQAIGEAGLESLVDLGFSGIGKGLGHVIPSSARANLKQDLLRRFFPADPATIMPENLQALKADPNFEISVGQGNKFGDFLQRTFSPAANNAMIAKQQAAIRGVLDRNKLNPEILVQTAQQNAQNKVAALRANRKLEYEGFEPFIKQNTLTLQREIPVPPHIAAAEKAFAPHLRTKPTYEDVSIEGAIPVHSAKNFAEKVGTQIEEVMGRDWANAASFDAGVSSNLRRIKTELDKIRSTQNLLDPKTKQPVESFLQYKKAQQLKTDISRLLKNKQFEPLKDQLSASLDALRNTLSADIKQGVELWGKRATSQLERAKKAHIKLAETVDPQLTRRLLRAGTDPDMTYLTVAENALSDPQKTRQFLTVTQDRRTTKQLFLNKLTESSFDPVTNTYDPATALKYLNDNKLVAKEAVPSQTLGNVERFFRRAQVVTPHVKDINMGLKLRLGTAGIALGIGTSTGLFTGNVPTGAQVGGAIILGTAGAHAFTNKILLNPRNARIAMGLLDEKATSKKAIAGQKVILGALKGLQVYIMAPDGTKTPATIQENGQIKPD